jgi:hypothetical protein
LCSVKHIATGEEPEDFAFDDLEDDFAHCEDCGKEYAATPRGMFTVILEQYGIDQEMSASIWNDYQALLLQALADTTPDAEYPCIVFDGSGGALIGMDMEEVTEDDDNECWDVIDE